MKLYLASRYSRRQEMERHAAMLRDQGHCIVSSWHMLANETLDTVILQEDYAENARVHAQVDLADLREADMLLLFADGEPSRGGRHFEAGYAYGIGMPIAIIGPVEQIFHRLPGVQQYATLDAWLNGVAGVDRAAGD